MASVATPEGRIGRPEEDQWLDRADAEQRALAELEVVGRAENLVVHARRRAGQRA